MSVKVTLRPISERAAKVAIGDTTVADALSLGNATGGLEKEDIFVTRIVSYVGVEALGLAWILDAGEAVGAASKHGQSRVLDAADSDRALMAVRDVTWSGGDDIRDDLEKVFALAVEKNAFVLVSLSE